MVSQKFEIWIEGSADNGGHSPATRLLREGELDSKWEGVTFQQAVVHCLNELKWLMLYSGLQGCGSSYYDSQKNTYWGCRFFDNEIDARKYFG